MNKNKIIKALLLFIVCFCIFPKSIFALNIIYDRKWTAQLNLPDQSFNTKGYSSTRKTSNVGGFYVNDLSGQPRVFCVEPGKAFNYNSGNGETGYSETSSVPTGLKYNVSSAVSDLEKVMSCYIEANTAKDTSVVAVQALVWELVSGERDQINANEILGTIGVPYPYQPYMSNGSVYGDQSGITSLYERIYENRNKNSYGADVYLEYRAILRCAARFNISTPSWAGDTPSKSKKQELTSYNDSTQTFSRTFTHNSSLEPNLFKYYTYTIGGKTADCAKGATVNGVTCSCNNKQCTFSTKNEISSSSPVRIEFKYTYKDNGTAKLNTDTTKYYTKTNYQTLMKGSTHKEFYIDLYTGEKPNYQIKVTKLDKETNNPISGVKFDIYSDSNARTKIGTTTATNAQGVATYSNITKIGTYYLKEANTPEGYKTNGSIYSINVTASNTVANKSYATKTITNESMKLNMTKYTIDSDGNRIKLDGDACEITECATNPNKENGPIFVITKDDKKVCVIPSSVDGKYTYSSLSESCPDGTTEKIKTCHGEFSIANIPAGTYTVTETVAACGTTLPSNPSQTITVVAGKDKAVTMENGVAGVVFHKVTENGNLLSGGKFSLQIKENGIYKDVLLKYDKGIIYKYDSNLTSESSEGTYLLNTYDGVLSIVNLPAGEYRFVEKEAPEGYSIIKDKDSTATFTITDKAQDEYYNVQLINHKEKTTGSYDSAELIVTIITGRKVINYVFLIGGLLVILVGLIFVRKKLRK